MKKIVSLFLSLLITLSVFVGTPIFVSAETTDNTVINNDTSEYIYYTDLFYAYPTYLAEDEYFKTYSSNIEGVYDTVHNAYQNSSLVVGTGLDYALDTITSPTDMAKLITDTLGLTDFSYSDALDAANNEFVRNILSESTVYSVEKAFGKTANINDKLNKVVSYFNKLELENANGNIDYNAEYYVQEAFDYLYDKGVFSYVNSNTLLQLWGEINSEDFALSDCFKLAETEIDIAKALVTAIMMEDERLVIVDQIIATQKSDTILKQGMVRLKNQLNGNFIDYFIKNYLVDKLADKIFEEINKIVVDVVTGKEISAIIKVVKKTFDFVVDVPSYGEVLKWQVLMCYSKDLAKAIPQVANTFDDGPFLSDKIIEYESLFTAYDAVNKSAMEATKNIADMDDPFGAAYAVLIEAVNNGIENVTVKSGGVSVSIPATTSSDDLYAIMLGTKTITTAAGGIFTIGKKIEISNGKTTVKVPIQANILSSAMRGTISDSQQVINNFNTIYGNVSVYGEHIKSIKDEILHTAYELRHVVKNWEYVIDSNTELREQSDTVEKGGLYTFNNSLLGNVNVIGNVTILFPIEVFGNFSCSTSAKSDISIINGATLKINGNLEFCTKCPNWLYSGNSYIRISEKSGIYVNGDFLLKGSDAVGHGHYANLCIDGTVNISGSFITNYSAYRIFSTANNAYLKIGKNMKMCVWNYTDKNYGAFSDGTIEIGGNYDADSGGLKFTGSSKVIFSGLEEQSIRNLITNSLTIKNKTGVKYLSNIYVNGLYDTEGNPINNNGFATIVNNATRFIQGYDYKNIQLQSNIQFAQYVKGTIYTNGFSITVPKNQEAVIDGSVYVNKTQLSVNGKLTVTGRLDIANNGSVYNNGTTVVNNVYLATMNYYAGLNQIINNGYFEITDRFESCSDRYANSRTGYRIKQSSPSAEFVVGGYFMANTSDVCDELVNGIVRFNGESYQYVKNLKAPTIIVDNVSTGGVTFATSISPWVLFNHKGNKFSLSGGGTFVDYDGDGKKDNVDPEPTVGNPCTITVKSDNLEYGTVSTESIETVGGTTHTISATPTFKYKFAKWVNSSGSTVSTSATYTFIAKNTTTLTAVFTKRTQPISKSAAGGTINAPSSAAIESEITVSVTENDGYIYKDGSLAYNGIAIEDYKFIMPDEPVTLTAEFVYNPNYFALKEKIDEAKAIKYNNYSAESFANLQNAVSNANSILENHITQEVSEQYIGILQTAIGNLAEKYIVSIVAKNTPTVYVGLDTLKTDLSVQAIYDNNTTVYVKDFTIENFDCNVAGEQEIIIKYGELTTTKVITVRLRSMYDVLYDTIPSQLFMGVGTTNKPDVVLNYCTNIDEYFDWGEPCETLPMIEGVDYTLTYNNNTAPGRATILVTGIGNYTGSITIGFTIYCEHNYEVVENIAPTCIENGYRKEVCSVCEDVKECYYTHVFTDNLPESTHNYANNTNITYTFKAKGAEYLDLLFSSSTKLESSYDYIYIYDSTGTQIGKYTGTTLTSKTIRVTGDTVKIKITSDGSVTYYGFSLDSITAKYPYEELKATGHTVTDWIVSKEPTIYEEGLKQQACSVCGEIVNEETIAKLIYYGDANGDGGIDVIDLVEIRSALLSSLDNNEFEECFDANGDGSIDAKDLVRLKKFLAGINVPIGKTENTVY